MKSQTIYILDQTHTNVDDTDDTDTCSIWCIEWYV